VENANHWHRRLLRARSERPRNGCTTERANELPPSDAECHLPRPQRDQATAILGRYHALTSRSAHHFTVDSSLLLLRVLAAVIGP
jgi:hypothetical protein